MKREVFSYKYAYVGVEKWAHCAAGVRGVIENERRLMRAVREVRQQASTLHDASKAKSTLLDASNPSTLDYLLCIPRTLIHHDT